MTHINIHIQHLKSKWILITFLLSISGYCSNIYQAYTDGRTDGPRYKVHSCCVDGGKNSWGKSCAAPICCTTWLTYFWLPKSKWFANREIERKTTFCARPATNLRPSIHLSFHTSFPPPPPQPVLLLNPLCFLASNWVKMKKSFCIGCERTISTCSVKFLWFKNQ